MAGTPAALASQPGSATGPARRLPDDGFPAHPAAALLAFDRAHVWHPYTSMTDPTPTRLVDGRVRASAPELADGRELVDGMSSWWAAIHGYRHPVLDAALRGQLGDMAHVMFGGLTHAPGGPARRAPGRGRARPGSSTSSSPTPAR